MKLYELTIREAHEKLKAREISATELTEAVLGHLEEEEEELHAFLTQTPELARKTARAVDEKVKNGEPISPLAGIPVAVKDNILVEGVRCTAASKILENYIASYNATVINKLREADAVIIGKTNLDEFAMGASTENSAFGATRNPHDFSRVPGGSSGGSAAAVRAHESVWALGSDTGGSIRQPASFCGVVGLKPTYGAVSRYGLIAMASSLDQIGPITKTVEDAGIVFGAISGKDVLDSTSVEFNFQFPVRDFQIQDLRIGVPREYFVEGIDPEVEKAVREAIKNFESLGARVSEVNLPHTKYALACYYLLVSSEVSANLARYDGIRYGESFTSEENLDLLRVYEKSRGEYLGDEVKRRVMLGTYALSAGYYDAYYLKAQKVRTLIRNDFEAAFEEVDVLVTPTAPTVAFKIGERSNDPLSMYLADVYTVSVNLAGLPAISLPCGRSQGLPVGLQLIGRHFDERTLLSLADICEKTAGKLSPTSS